MKRPTAKRPLLHKGSVIDLSVPAAGCFGLSYWPRENKMRNHVFYLKPYGIRPDGTFPRLKLSFDEWADLRALMRFCGLIIDLRDVTLDSDAIKEVLGAFERAVQAVEKVEVVQKPAPVENTKGKAPPVPAEKQMMLHIPRPAPRGPRPPSDEELSVIEKVAPFLRDECRRGVAIDRRPC
jgi:hypothetical protein